MSITSGVGLVSGIDIKSLVDQLIAIEQRPRNLITQRNTILKTQQTAYQEVNAKLLAFKSTASGLISPTAFNPKTATSSDEAVMSVSATASASPGTYSFRVHQLVSGQQTITSGFADKDSTFIAPNGTTLTFDNGRSRLDSQTQLSQLNGGSGIQRGYIRVTDRSGASALIDLTDVVTAQDVLDRINNTVGINVFATVTDEGFVLTDLTGQTTSNMIVQEVGIGTTANSLGLAANIAGDMITGNRVNTIGQKTILADLNDGNGVGISSGVKDLRITLRDGTNVDVDLSGAATIGDVIEKIHAESAGNVSVAVNASGTGLQLADNTAGGGTLAVSALNNSTAASDLGIELTDDDNDGTIDGQRVISAINSKLLRNLNGGNGVNLGEIDITNRNGATTRVNLAGAQSISDVIAIINNSGAEVTASLNTAGNGLKLTDNTGATGSDLTIAEVDGGTTAEGLGIAGTFDDNVADSGNLQYSYVRKSTRFESLGVQRGQFRITDSNGRSATVDLTQGNELTMGDILSEINSRGLDINARINDTGDGIVLEDLGSGAVAIKVEDEGSTTARDLGLIGHATEPGQNIEGSFQKSIEIAATDTLQKVVNKINEAKVGVNASIINDGSSGAPFRISLSSVNAGKGAAFVFDDGGLGLEATTLTEASDAVVFYGSHDPAKAILITSSTNTLENVVPGAKLTLNATSNQNVQINVAKDEAKIVGSIQKLVTDFNGIITSIDKYDTYDEETKQRGLLLGDSTVNIVRNSLFSVMINANSDLSTQYKSLSQIGITVGSGGKMLEFNEEKFRSALQNDPDAVQNLFTFKETAEDDTVTSKGIGVTIDDLLKRLTDTDYGQIQTRIEAINQQVSINDKRIADMNKILEMKRQRLEAEFFAMESALAQMQGQSNALAGMQPIQPLNMNRNNR